MIWKKHGPLLVGLLSILLIAPCVLFTPQPEGNRTILVSKVHASSPHAPISIQYDSGLAAFPNKTGTGDPGTPYVIQDLEIDCGYSGSGIVIEDTRKYLVIKNCTVLNSGSTECGVGFTNCTNIRVENCTVGNCHYGIVMDGNCGFNAVHNCTIYSSHWVAIMHGNSANNTISDNHLYDNYGEGGLTGYGMVLHGQNVTVVGNTIERNEDVALYATNLANSTISGNTITGTINGASSDFADILLATSSGNSIIGNRLGNGTSQSITLKASCNGNAIESNVMVNGGAGIYITSCQQNVLRNNTIWDQDYFGIYLYQSGTHVVEGNDVRRCGFYGMQLYSSTGNVICNNILVNNTDFGLYISTSAFSTVIARNIIAGNKDGAAYNQIFDACANIYDQNTIDATSDLDGDGLPDLDEWSIHHTDRFKVDTDGDNFLDGYEIDLWSDPLDATDTPMIDQTQYLALLAMLEGNKTLLLTLLQWADGNATRLQELLDEYMNSGGEQPSVIDVGLSIIVGSIIVAGAICVVGLLAISKKRGLAKK
nr:right-handed parallel beta-helix repeat-containing protein [Candidatus Sigynarchaeum springense]